ncbi:hypothetical protein LCGC14_0995560 [marine sediment metagenome]|uniref:Uncharacterized protein n=1 Tax=marine sediment metagenome TaxID=412755 RepID=A0A0F9N4J4_9ZZZZ
MKILGHSGLKPRTEKVRIGVSEDDDTPIELVLKAPRLHSLTRIDEELQEPEPPEAPEAPATGDVARDNRGRVRKDEFDRPIVARNYEDPAYLKALEDHKAKLAEHEKVEAQYGRASTMGMLLECLGGQVVLNVSRDDYQELKHDGTENTDRKGSMVDYYDAVWDEFEAANIDLVALGQLSKAALRLTGVEDSEISDAKATLGSTSGN